jgi:peptidoglycan/xylan/chitin deacetylase (PgdA/CDA1 family)/CelD/BcsL family acetyltransferase involved in cellulose biosynthesis
MKLVEIRGETEFQNLGPEWNALLSESGSNTIFLTWEWASAWWRAYGTPSELRVLTVYDDAGVLRGIAPLRAKALKRYGQQVQALQFIGDAPSDCDSDYLDFISAPGHEQPVIDALQRYWEDQVTNGTVLLLNEIPGTSPNLPALYGMAEAAGLDRVGSDVACSTVKLPEEWDAYLAMLKPRFRTKVRSVLRNLENREEVRFGFCRTSEEVERLLPILYDLHERRWQDEGKPGVFGDPRKRQFYRELSALLLGQGWLRFSWLEYNGRVLACQYGFTYNGVYFQLQEGYEPDSEHWNVGAGLRAWSIREFLKEGVREYDFMAGTGRHKMDWGAELKQSKRLLLARKSRKNLLFLHGPEWDVEARKSLRAVLPQKVVAALEARNEAGNGAAGGEWIRQAAAKCYVRSGAPALARRLRAQYQVTIGHNGWLPKISWQKRVQGSARIFYYHRVNNDNDPYFDAITTDLFEVHMRYLARHYKVVSLAEVHRHLEGGDSNEMVVGVTFDDGYRDNYECAFPILKRYNIPATIFLTTGVLDSGELLWFEQLAEAVKKTGQEYIDLEIDIPRRFWMRNQPERLESNRRIFGLLRGFSDTDRRTWLADILGRLGRPGDSERKGKMLTWDQVRLMNANGIDFGGHTVTHPFLSKLTPRQAEWEISECKRRIDEETQKPADFFAYPNGREEDFAASNKELLRNAGYRGAVTTIWGMNYRTTDRMEMRRGGPWENSPEMFALKLDWYQLANQ